MDWRSLDLALVPDVPSMLGGPELRFLYSYARDTYSGRGEMVDLGAFLGSSAATLAAGLQANPRVADKDGRIHSYDFFEYIHSFYGPLIPNEGLRDGDSTLPTFWKHLGPLARHVRATKGDITAQPWSAPIEFLFVDFTQNWAYHQGIINNFYPHLSPGSVLVHQDYSYVLCYWLRVFMERC